MKRPKEILLDFTPLLDITMILIFFFVLFSRLGVDDLRQQSEQALRDAAAAQAAAQQTAEDAQAAADAAIAEAEEMQQEAAEQLRILEKVSAEQAASAEAIEQFAAGENLKLRLLIRDDTWHLRVQRGSGEPSFIPVDEPARELQKALQATGIDTEDIILCEFAYDAAEPGSYQAYKAASAALETVRQAYPNLYISETNLAL